MGDVHNEIKYLTGALRAVRLGLGIGESDGLVRVDESLTVISDWWARPDWAILAGDGLAWGRCSLSAPGAGLRAMLALANPSGSGRVFNVERMSIGSNPGGVRVVAPAPVVGAGGWVDATDEGTRDTRGSAAGRLMTNVTVAVVGNARYWLGPFYESTLPVVIGPNTALILDAGTDNAALQAGVAWRERALLPGEPPSNR